MPLFLCLAVATEIKTNEWTEMCGSRKYPYHPHRRDLPYGPLPSGFFQNRPPKFNPPPLRNFQNFCTPLEILLSLIEVNKEVVLFARIPNFVSFMYFLLNCIRDRQIPYANSLCAQVTNKILWVSRIFCWILQQISEFLLHSSHEEIGEKVLGHTKI